MQKLAEDLQVSHQEKKGKREREREREREGEGERVQRKKKKKRKEKRETLVQMWRLDILLMKLSRGWGWVGDGLNCDKFLPVAYTDL